MLVSIRQMASELRNQRILELYDIDYLQMSDGVQLRLLVHKASPSKGTIFFHPGLGTLLLSWERVLEMLADEGYTIYYVESREKYTAKYPKKAKLTRELMIRDCAEAVRLIGLEDNTYIAVGSSLGSTILIHAMAQGLIFPKHAVLVGPNAEMKLPMGLKLLLPLVNDTIYRISKPLIKWYILKKYVDKEADPEQYHKYALGIDLSVPSRFRKVLRAWLGNKIWDDLPLIKSHCVLVGAEKDKLHASNTTRRIADLIPDSDYIDLGTNKAAHDKPLVDLILSLDV